MSYPSINRVVVIGRLTRDPELRALPSGAGVCALRIACNSSRRDSAGGYSERPNFFDVSVYGTPAENVARYTRKGSRVAIDGRLEWREWEMQISSGARPSASSRTRSSSSTVRAGTTTTKRRARMPLAGGARERCGRGRARLLGGLAACGPGCA